MPNENERLSKLHKFEKSLGYKFKNIDYLNLALTHGSFRQDGVDVDNNERMACLGDAILGAIICDYGYHECPNCGKGELTNLKIDVVNNSVLASCAIEKLNLPEYIAFGESIIHDDERETQSILATTLEAVIGSIYLDGGLESARSFVLAILKDEIEDAMKKISDTDIVSEKFKTAEVKIQQGKESGNYIGALLEYCQEFRIQRPEYEVTHTGPPNDRIFRAKVTVEGHSYGPGESGKKRIAQQEAGRIALEELLEKMNPQIALYK